MSCCNEQLTNNCEPCTEIVLSDCVMYKGYITNNMGLSTNFRLKQFIEAAIAKLNSISELNIDKYVTAVNMSRSGHSISISATRSDDQVLNSPSVSLTHYFAKLIYNTHSLTIAANQTNTLTANSDTTVHISQGHSADSAANRIVTNNSSTARTSAIKLTIEGSIRVPNVVDFVYIDILQSGSQIASFAFGPTNNLWSHFSFSHIPSSGGSVSLINKGIPFTLRYRVGTTTNTDTGITTGISNLSLTAEELTV